jgi:hypothetical protein
MSRLLRNDESKVVSRMEGSAGSEESGSSIEEMRPIGVVIRVWLLVKTPVIS